MHNDKMHNDKMHNDKMHLINKIINNNTIRTVWDKDEEKNYKTIAK